MLLRFLLEIVNILFSGRALTVNITKVKVGLLVLGHGLVYCIFPFWAAGAAAGAACSSISILSIAMLEPSGRVAMTPLDRHLGDQVEALRQQATVAIDWIGRDVKAREVEPISFRLDSGLVALIRPRRAR